MKLLSILKETVDEKASFTDKYDSEMTGGQKKLPDELQKAILKKKGLKKEANTPLSDLYDLVTSLVKQGITKDEILSIVNFATAKLDEGMDHEVSMAQSSLEVIVQSAQELMTKMGQEEKDIPGWIQDHITNAENYINQANKGYHEL